MARHSLVGYIQVLERRGGEGEVLKRQIRVDGGDGSGLMKNRLT